MLIHILAFPFSKEREAWLYNKYVVGRFREDYVPPRDPIVAQLESVITPELGL